MIVADLARTAWVLSAIVECAGHWCLKSSSRKRHNKTNRRTGVSVFVCLLYTPLKPREHWGVRGLSRKRDRRLPKEDFGAPTDDYCLDTCGGRKPSARRHGPRAQWVRTETHYHILPDDFWIHANVYATVNLSEGLPYGGGQFHDGIAPGLSSINIGAHFYRLASNSMGSYENWLGDRVRREVYQSLFQPPFIFGTRHLLSPTSQAICWTCRLCPPASYSAHVLYVGTWVG